MRDRQGRFRAASFPGFVHTPHPHSVGLEMRSQTWRYKDVPLESHWRVSFSSTGLSSAAFYYASVERGIWNLFHCQLRSAEDGGAAGTPFSTKPMLPWGLITVSFMHPQQPRWLCLGFQSAVSPRNSENAVSACPKHWATSHPLLPQPYILMHPSQSQYFTAKPLNLFASIIHSFKNY